MRDFLVTYKVPLITMGIITAAIALDQRFRPGGLELENRGSEALAARRPQQAIDYFGKALRLNPGDAGARAGLAAAYGAMGLTEQAIAQYEMSVVKSSETLKQSYLSLEALSEKLGRKDEAKRYHRSALAIDQVSK